MQGIIIQGPTNYFKEISDHYSQYPNVVWATWDDESISNLDYIRSKGIQVILLNKPLFPGYMNVNMQVKSTFEGIKALENRVEEVLKVRSDIIISNLSDLMLELKGRQLSFMATCKTGIRKDLVYDLIYYHTSHDYPSDNVIYGKIEDMLMMFDFQIEELLPIPPESLIAWNYMVNKDIEFKLEYQHMVNNGISFFTNICLDKKVDVHWLKQNVNLVDWYKDRKIYEW
jgi:hypothetical protein